MASNENLSQAEIEAFMARGGKVTRGEAKLARGVANKHNPTARQMVSDLEREGITSKRDFRAKDARGTEPHPADVEEDWGMLNGHREGWEY